MIRYLYNNWLATPPNVIDASYSDDIVLYSTKPIHSEDTSIADVQNLDTNSYKIIVHKSGTVNFSNSKDTSDVNSTIQLTFYKDSDDDEHLWHFIKLHGFEVLGQIFQKAGLLKKLVLHIVELRKYKGTYRGIFKLFDLLNIEDFKLERQWVNELYDDNEQFTVNYDNSSQRFKNTDKVMLPYDVMSVEHKFKSLTWEDKWDSDNTLYRHYKLHTIHYEDDSKVVFKYNKEVIPPQAIKNSQEDFRIYKIPLDSNTLHSIEIGIDEEPREISKQDHFYEWRPTGGVSLEILRYRKGLETNISSVDTTKMMEFMLPAVNYMLQDVKKTDSAQQHDIYTYLVGHKSQLLRTFNDFSSKVSFPKHNHSPYVLHTSHKGLLITEDGREIKLLKGYNRLLTNVGNIVKVYLYVGLNQASYIAQYHNSKLLFENFKQLSID